MIYLRHAQCRSLGSVSSETVNDEVTSIVQLLDRLSLKGPVYTDYVLRY
jgi:hypothetical protein